MKPIILALMLSGCSVVGTFDEPCPWSNINCNKPLKADCFADKQCDSGYCNPYTDDASDMRTPTEAGGGFCEALP